jgi:RNA polymerase sigma-70 factor, ECF subfamily
MKTGAGIQGDLELRDRCVDGGRPEMAHFIRTYSDLIYRTIQHVFRRYRIPCPADDLKDLHHTVFVKLFENRCRRLRRYRGDNGCRLASWIRLVVIRIVINELRASRGDGFLDRRGHVSIDSIVELADPGDGPWEHLERQDQKRRLQDAVARLSSREQLFCRLHFETGLPLSEVAEILSISSTAAYTLKHRAIQRLKAMLTGEN